MEFRWPRRIIAGGLVPVALALTACERSGEVAVQQARVGDLLVRTKLSRVELAKPFRPGIPNGLYRGAVRVKGPGGKPEGSLHEVNAVCSIKGEPGWQSYDNLYGEPIQDLKQVGQGPTQQRWQILYHFDGRIEANGRSAPHDWTARLKDNLCRRGDFDDRPDSSRR